MTEEAATATSQISAVLHPTDLTSSSELAFAHALRLAASGRTKLYLLHADPSAEDTDWSAYPAVRRTLASWGMLDEGSLPSVVFDQLGVQVAKVRIPDRDAVRAILNFLEGHPSDVIVLATHGREGLPRWLHGSVAEPIARAAESTTLFIRQGARGFVTPDNGAIQLRRVLIPVDRQPRPTYALRAAWDIVRMLGAQGTTLQLLHVGSELDPSSVEVDPGTWSSVEHSSRSGEVVEQILAAADEGSVDMIAMATAGHQGFLDALRGSTTERVVRLAPCPVLAVPTTFQTRVRWGPPPPS